MGCFAILILKNVYTLTFPVLYFEKNVQVGKDQEKAKKEVYFVRSASLVHKMWGSNIKLL